jgi:hypothetical protein
MAPVKAPRLKAKAAYPMGTMSRSSKLAYWLALRMSKPRNHHVTARVRLPATRTVAAIPMASLVMSHLLRETLWVHAKRKVPASNSRAQRGAPKKMPSKAGVTRSRKGRAFWRKCCCDVYRAVAAGQSPAV